MDLRIMNNRARFLASVSICPLLVVLVYSVKYIGRKLYFSGLVSLVIISEEVVLRYSTNESQ